MKNLIIAFALLLSFSSGAQQSIELKKGAQLTYAVEQGTKKYNLVVKVEDLSPLKISYKSSDGSYKGTLANGSNSKSDVYSYDYFIPPSSRSGQVGAIMVSEKVFDEVEKLNKKFRDGIDLGIGKDTLVVNITFEGDSLPTLFGNIGYQTEEIKANGKPIKLGTYVISQIKDAEGKEVPINEGYSMRLNMDDDSPVVVYLKDTKGKFTIRLIEANGVEVDDEKRE